MLYFDHCRVKLAFLNRSAYVLGLQLFNSCSHLLFSSPEWPGKRLRLDSQVLNVASLESAACSSIVSASQFSQWPGKQHYGGSIPWSSSEYLLGMLRKFTDHAAFSHTASQGPRGVQVYSNYAIVLSLVCENMASSFSPHCSFMPCRLSL